MGFFLELSSLFTDQFSRSKNSGGVSAKWHPARWSLSITSPPPFFFFLSLLFFFLQASFFPLRLSLPTAYSFLLFYTCPPDSGFVNLLGSICSLRQCPHSSPVSFPPWPPTLTSVIFPPNSPSFMLHPDYPLFFLLLLFFPSAASLFPFFFLFSFFAKHRVTPVGGKRGLQAVMAHLSLLGGGHQAWNQPGIGYTVTDPLSQGHICPLPSLLTWEVAPVSRWG